jgi:hypothetical protein
MQIKRLQFEVTIDAEKYDSLPDRSKVQLNGLLSRTLHAITNKYIDGQLEHGGFLLDRDCLHEAYAEALDLITYIDAVYAYRDEDDGK